MSIFLRITYSLRFWFVVCGCVFLGIVLGESGPLFWTFQQPTYLIEKDTIGLSDYTCDPSHSECKINFDFRPSIPTEEPESHYICQIDFGFGPTDQDTKCNPDTVIFPSGSHRIHLAVTHKETGTLLKEGGIIIHNSVSDGGGGGDTETGTDTGVLPVYSAQIQWQSSSDLLSKTDVTLSEYTCDSTQSECHINLLVVPNKNSLADTQLTCLITASFELLPSISDPCNPLQSIIPSGDHSVTIQILQKSDSTIVATRVITLKNPFIDISIDPLRVTSNLTWQSPTYLGEKDDSTLTEYTCNPAQADCKINLLITPLLDGVMSSDLTCDITSDFTLEPTTDPCNPNTSLVPPGDHILTIKILQKTDSTLLITRDIVLKNPIIDTSIDPLRVTSTFTWQSPSYLLLKDDSSLTEYTCDPVQTDCKINLTVTPLLDGLESSRLTCEITSDFILEPTSDPCNPNTSIIPNGDHILTIKILQKSDDSLLVTREILLKNPERIVEGGSSGGGGGESSGGFISQMDLSTTQLTIQSGLDVDGVCRSDICQVNFLAEVPAGALCRWNFGTGIFETAGTDMKCNPGYVRFPFNTEIILSVSDPNYITNSVQKTLSVSRENSVVSSLPPQAIIDLQGVLGKNKRITSDGISCAIGREDACSVNLTAESSLHAKTFFWDLGNGKTSDRENPGVEKYPLGRHRVTLRVYNVSGVLSESYFTIDVVEKFDVLPEIICLDCEKMKGKIQISAVLPNPPHADTVEWIEITNTSSMTWNLSSCVLSDSTKKFTLSEKMSSGKILRLRQSLTGISLGNSKEILELRCGEFLIDTFSWDFNIPSGYILRRDMLDAPPVRVSVLGVIDGDTLDVMLHSKKTRIRLLGVDTPETVHPLKSVEKFGIEASDFTKKTLTGKTVWLTFDHELFDHYGRTLGYIWQCDADFDTEKCELFNARLITEGYARMERRFEFMLYDDFDVLEKFAKKNKVGIWSDSEVVKDLEKLSAEEAENLRLAQEAEYLKLQLELLELAKQECGEEEICQEMSTWGDITKNLTTLSVRSLKSGILKVSGRTWGDFPLKVRILSGEKEVYTTTVNTDTTGEYVLEWYPRVTGEYRVEVILEEGDSLGLSEKGVLILGKTLQVENISDHFLALLIGSILVQGAMTKNRWMGEDGVFHCLSRGSCSVNLTAEYNRRDHLTYTWKLPNGEIFVDKNPPSFKIGYGDFIIQLDVSDMITGESSRQILSIRHRAFPKSLKKASSSSSKYTLDFKDATLDVGGGAVQEVDTLTFSQSLLALFVLGSLSLLFFGKDKIDSKNI